ncbi:transposase [Rhodobacter sp. ETT8]|uniref:Transposase n=1 Tax=Pseudotabrizicola algicola TaxID=2709381 RepID=A0A6B3RT00_9RHOB|nr:Tn3 family transposase [Nitrosomonas nitrosa]NEX48473.1 transposase [Pseudotabrizicola algicola]
MQNDTLRHFEDAAIEAHHALKNALRIGRQGEIRDRTVEGQHYRMAGLNLLAAIMA